MVYVYTCLIYGDIVHGKPNRADNIDLLGMDM